ARLSRRPRRPLRHGVGCRADPAAAARARRHDQLRRLSGTWFWPRQPQALVAARVARPAAPCRRALIPPSSRAVTHHRPIFVIPCTPLLVIPAKSFAVVKLFAGMTPGWC